MYPNMSAIVETTEIIKNWNLFDEAYIEMTNTKHLFHNGDILKIIMEIKDRIFKATS